MTANEKRAALVNKIMSREKKNTYTNDTTLRLKVGGEPAGKNGWSDCSSCVQWVYKQALGVNVGGYTVSQIQSKLADNIDENGVTGKNNGMPDVSKLQPGDLLFYKGTNKARPFTVGHVEMYIGAGKICGHGTGKGPFIQDLVAYTEKRNKLGRNNYIMARRFVRDDVSQPVAPPITDNTYYTIVRGDTLSGIAKKFSTTVAELANINNIANVNKIKTGQVLIIKLGSEGIGGDPDETAQLTYTVVRGDNLAKIAKQFNTTVNKLVNLNKIKNKNVVYTGQVLMVK